MIDVANAVAVAKNFLLAVYPDAAGVRLEEVEYAEDEHVWFVTLSLFPSASDYSQMAQAVAGRSGRIYKIIKMGAAEGNVVSMKIRTVE